MSAKDAVAHGQACRTNPCERCVEAELRAREALARIEKAQVLLDDACAQLSSLVGAAPQWRRAGQLADQAKALWQRINDRHWGYTLDEMSSPRVGLAKPEGK